MKMFKHIIIALMLTLICICSSAASTYAADTEITTAADTTTSTGSTENIDSNETSGYLIVVLAAILGALVSLAFWNRLGV